MTLRFIGFAYDGVGTKVTALTTSGEILPATADFCRKRQVPRMRLAELHAKRLEILQAEVSRLEHQLSQPNGCTPELTYQLQQVMRTLDRINSPPEAARGSLNG